MENHYRTHDSWTCTGCGKLFKTSDALQYHIKKCHAENEERCVCKTCGESFLDITTLKAHETSHVKGNECMGSMVKTCQEKEATSCNDNNTQEETSSVKKSKDKPCKDSEGFKCEICHATFKVRRLYNFHKLVLHTDNKCRQCGHIFLSKADKENHRKIHINSKLTCSECGKVYKSIGGLQFHVKTCNKKNKCSWACEMCGKRFLNMAALKKHEELHAEGEQHLTCKVCDKTYPHIRALKIHRRRVHLVSQRVHCNICNKGFKQQDALEKHMEYHAGKKSYGCRFCGCVFAQKDNLKDHMDVHAGLLPYCCQNCEHRFKSKQTFNKHVSKCSKKQTAKVPENTKTSDTSVVTITIDD